MLYVLNPKTELMKIDMEHHFYLLNIEMKCLLTPWVALSKISNLNTQTLNVTCSLKVYHTCDNYLCKMDQTTWMLAIGYVPFS